MAFVEPRPYFKPPMGFIENLKVKCIKAGRDAAVYVYQKEKARLK